MRHYDIFVPVVKKPGIWLFHHWRMPEVKHPDEDVPRSNSSKVYSRPRIQNSSFTDEEKHYAFYLLKATALLYKALSFEDFDPPGKFQGTVLQRERINKYLKSRLRKHLGRKPFQHKKRSFQVDANMYDCRKDDRGGLWIAVMGLTPRKRVKLLLTSSVVPEGNIRIVLAGESDRLSEKNARRRMLCAGVKGRIRLYELSRGS